MRRTLGVQAFAGVLLLAAVARAQVPAHATLLNPTTAQTTPTFAQQGDVVHAFGRSSATLYHARSLDGGRTWPALERPLGTFLDGISANAFATVAVTVRGSELLLVGNDRQVGPRFVRSVDAGATWSSPVTVAANAVPNAVDMLPGLHADGATLVVAWTNDHPLGRVVCNRSLDNGVTWQPVDTRLDLPPATSVSFLHVLGAGPIVHVFWSHYQKSTDGGATWLPQAISLPGVGSQPLGPVTCAAGDGPLLVVGSFYGSGGLVRSNDAGATWTPVTGHGIPVPLSVAVAGSLVVAAGSNNFIPPTFFVNTSADAGITWRPSPLALPSPAFGPTPHTLARPGELFVRWQIPGFPGNAIRTTDAGVTWQVIDGPVQAGFDASDVRTLHAESTGLTAAFPRHHAYVGVGSSRLGAGTIGTGNVAPQLTTAGLPVRGGSTTLQGSGAVGGSLAALAFSFASPTAMPFGGGTVHLASLDVVLALPTSGPTGQAGTGTFAATLAIPNNPALVGTSLVTQALVFDGGAAAGFTVTNALEIWLR